ncbi:hypothetical protein VIGAN_03053400 [Vigna angularis var. angularis]|uniref:Uncharacterized protein n=1 Tax=Vigna angularis var. angularis TaxID=157739 RepID=A0A0S3RK39_PHAAN|nr:hypothetical protein VIGAN_03053400 [Vigna angularis var. angularis]
MKVLILELEECCTQAPNHVVFCLCHLQIAQHRFLLQTCSHLPLLNSFLCSESFFSLLPEHATSSTLSCLFHL